MKTKISILDLVADKPFRNERVVIDNKRFVGCSFEDCTFVYEGGTSFDFERCRIEQNQLELGRVASQTIASLYSLRANLFPRQIDEVIRVIQEGPSALSGDGLVLDNLN